MRRVLFEAATRLAAVAAVGLAASTAAAGATPTADSLDFQRTFDRPAAVGPLAYTATYLTAGVTHHLAVWRDGDHRIKRRTDDAIESFVVRPAGAVEWSMTVLDLKRRIRTDVDRTNLMRIGYAENWFAQTHALAAPRGEYRLTASKAGVAGAAASGPCRWYRLDQPQRSSRLCWSENAGIPLVIVDAEGTTVWHVDTLSTRRIAPAVFEVADQGFVRNNANDDIQPD